VTNSDWDKDKDQEVPVASPCTGVCKLDDTGVCIGCFRDREEITYWTTYLNAEKAKVLDNCHNRKISGKLATEVKTSRKKET